MTSSLRGQRNLSNYRTQGNVLISGVYPIYRGVLSWGRREGGGLSDSIVQNPIPKVVRE